MWRRWSARRPPAAGRTRGPSAQRAATAPPTAPRRAAAAAAPRAPPAPPLPSAGAPVAKAGAWWSGRRSGPRTRGTACGTRVVVVEPHRARSTCRATPAPFGADYFFAPIFAPRDVWVEETRNFTGIPRNSPCTPTAPSSAPSLSRVPAPPLLALPPALQAAHRLGHVLRRAREGDAHPPLAWLGVGVGVSGRVGPGSARRARGGSGEGQVEVRVPVRVGAADPAAPLSSKSTPGVIATPASEQGAAQAERVCQAQGSRG